MATGIGETLRAARRQQGRTLAEAAAETRVRETYLAALEEEEFLRVGGDVYAKGFLRSYARYLGLDPEPLLETYRREYEHPDESLHLSQATAPVAPPERRPGLALVAAGAVILLIGLAVIGLRAGGNAAAPTEAPPPPPQPAAETPAPDPDPGPPVTEDEPDTELPALEGVEVELTVTGSLSWVRVVVDGDVVLEGERANGFVEAFSGEEEVLVRVGDAASVQLVVNGEDQGGLGEPQQVVELRCLSGQVMCEREEIT
jgi:cytoskeleton protein RodZ